jgi:hypothetical protein
MNKVLNRKYYKRIQRISVTFNQVHTKIFIIVIAEIVNVDLLDQFEIKFLWFWDVFSRYTNKFAKQSLKKENCILLFVTL